MKRTEDTNWRDIQQHVRLKRIVDGSMSCPEGRKKYQPRITPREEFSSEH
jgi:hypothetical protein